MMGGPIGSQNSFTIAHSMKKSSKYFAILSLDQIYVRAGLGKFGPTQPLTTNLCPDLLSFFNFLLSLQPLAWRVSCSNQFKQENLRKVKTELQLRQQKQTPIWLSPDKNLISYLEAGISGSKSCFHLGFRTETDDPGTWTVILNCKVCESCSLSVTNVWYLSGISGC